MVLALVAVGVALLLGALIGWMLRGPLRWCARCGDSLRCPTCSPLPAVGRAPVRWQTGRASTVDRDRPLLTRGAENRAPRISRRSI